MGLDLELQSSRYHNLKALDEIYKINVGSHLGQRPTMLGQWNFRCFQDLDIFSIFQKMLSTNSKCVF